MQNIFSRSVIQIGGKANVDLSGSDEIWEG
jgi:hypothetical protein